MKTLIGIIVQGIAVFISAYLLPGVHVESFLTAIVVAVVLAIVNAIVKPIFVILTLPITIVTLGIFYLVINAIMILLVTAIVPGFTVDGLWTALLFSIVLSIVRWAISALSSS